MDAMDEVRWLCTLCMYACLSYLTEDQKQVCMYVKGSISEAIFTYTGMLR